MPRCSTQLDFKLTTLKSGVKVYYNEQPTQRQVTVGTLISRGSIHDPPGKAGLHHFGEHWPLSGTKNFPNYDQASEKLEAFNGELDDETGHTNITYNCAVSSRGLTLAIKLIGDLTLNWVFGKKRLHNNKQIMLREIRKDEQSPEELLRDKFMSFTFQGTPYGWPIFGKSETVNTFTLEDVKAINQEKNSENIGLVIVGRFSLNKILPQLERTFASVAPPNPDLVKPIFRLPLVDQPLIIRTDDFWCESNIIIASQPQPPPELMETIYWDLWMAMLGEDISGPTLRWRENTGLFYDWASDYNFNADWSQFTFSIHTQPDRRDDLIKGFWQLVDDTLNSQKRFALAVRRRLECTKNYQEKSDEVWNEAINHLETYGRIVPASEKIQLYDSAKLAELQKLIGAKFNPKSTYVFCCEPPTE